MNDMTPPRLSAPETHLLLPAPETERPGAPTRGGARRWVIAAALALLAAVLGWGVWRHWHTDQQAAQTQQQTNDFRPMLRVATAKREDGPITLTLPGATASLDMARLYARATGYVAERRVDIGSRVHKGDLLLRIEAADLDAQLVQAAAQLGQTRAALIQAQANVQSAQSNIDLARVTNQRASTLAAQGWETKQNADNTRANVQSGGAAVEAAQAGVTVAEANVAAQAATLQRLQALVGYEQVIAPFDGVVTERGIDTGDLVSADAGAGTALFTLQRDDTLRVQVYVPQSAAVALHDGLEAQVTVPELPGQVFKGVVARSSVALDPASRALLIEVDVPNPEARLRPGLYVQVQLEVPRANPGLEVPDEAVILNADGLRVAVVEDGHVHLRPITIARDYGTTVELRGGLNGGEQVALSPPVDLADNQAVQVQPPDPPNNGADQGKGQQTAKK